MLKESTPPLSPFPVSKRRPPKFDFTSTIEKKLPPAAPEPESPLPKHYDNVAEDTLQLSDSDSSGPPSPIGSKGPILQVVSSREDPLPDDMSKDLAALQQLRKSVKKNLRLRPIRSRGNLPKVNVGADMISAPLQSSLSTSPRSPNPHSATSPTSSIASSYFTPTLELPLCAFLPISASSIGDRPPLPSPASLPQTVACPISPESLYTRLVSVKRPLLIDTRPAAAHQSFHLRHSINVAIPSLILKRFRRPGGGLPNLDALRQYITSDQGKSAWDTLMRPGGPWDGDVVMYDDEMDPKDKDHLGVTAWAIIPVISPLLSYGSVDYLEGGVALARHHPTLSTLLINGCDPDIIDNNFITDSAPMVQTPGAFQGGMRKGAGLFQLNTQMSILSRPLPEIEPSSSTSSHPRSPLPMMSSTSSLSSSLNSVDSNPINVIDASPSPPPSSISFRTPSSPRRPSVPNLRRLDTKSAERLNTNLPKLSVRTKPMRSATLTVPPSLSIIPPPSPSHLQLMYSNHTPPPSARFGVMSPTSDPANYLTPYFTPPHTPGTPKAFLPPSPATARPELDPPSTDEAFPVFTISTILPNFLFLGPEPATPEHVEELQELGVKRILNIAAECDDDHGLKLKEVFEKYYKIPMRDTVEEENIARGVREVCDILGMCLFMALFLANRTDGCIVILCHKMMPVYIHRLLMFTAKLVNHVL